MIYYAVEELAWVTFDGDVKFPSAPQVCRSFSRSTDQDSAIRILHHRVGREYTEIQHLLRDEGGLFRLAGVSNTEHVRANWGSYNGKDAYHLQPKEPPESPAAAPPASEPAGPVAAVSKPAAPAKPKAKRRGRPAGAKNRPKAVESFDHTPPVEANGVAQAHAP